MSKYSCLRPAGMSDDDDDDDDDYMFIEDVKDRPRPSRKNSRKTENDFDNVNVIEDHADEDDAISACIRGELTAIQNYLRTYDVNKYLHSGWTLLLYASSLVQPEMIEYLLKFNADPNKSKEGFTPLMALCHSAKGTNERSLKCLMLLMQAKADVNLTNKQRETALMHACTSKNAEFVAELIKHTNDINTTDSDGKTALNYATMANKLDIVKILLEHNADTSLMDKNCLSPKDIAYEKGFTEIFALLTKDDEEKPEICEVFDRKTWRDYFPDLYPRRKEVLDEYISDMLYGMGLDSYKILFQGINLKTFLHLTEDEVCQLGIDISVHKEQFLEDLETFHHREWKMHLFANIDPIYDNIISLGNIKENISVICASFQYIKQNLMKAASEDIYLSPCDILKYEAELKETQKNLKNLKDAIISFKKLAQKIDKEDDIGVPAIYIGPKKSKSNWIIPLSVSLMIGLCLYKTTYIQRLWNI